MTFLLIAIISGILSVLAPCIIAMVPILVGYSADSKNIYKALRVVVGLSTSIFIFSLLLKGSTLLINVEPKVWQLVSGGIILGFGIFGLFPSVWERMSVVLRLQQLSAKGQRKALKKGGAFGEFLLGASLGPIFSACSPTYALILAVILPSSPVRGVFYLLVFIASLSSTLLLFALLGQKAIKKFGWSLDPHSWFKRTTAVIFIVIGLLIITGADKTLLTHAVKNGWFDWQVRLESGFNIE